MAINPNLWFIERSYEIYPNGSKKQGCTKMLSFLSTGMPRDIAFASFVGMINRNFFTHLVVICVTLIFGLNQGNRLDYGFYTTDSKDDVI